MIVIAFDELAEEDLSETCVHETTQLMEHLSSWNSWNLDRRAYNDTEGGNTLNN